MAPSPTAPTMPGPSPRTKQWHHSPDPTGVLPPSETASKATQEGPPSLKWQEVMPLYKVLTRSHHEALSRDSHLVRKAREEYYRDHPLNFNSETSCNLADVFQCMIETAGLLGSAIYEVKEAWTG